MSCVANARKSLSDRISYHLQILITVSGSVMTVLYNLEGFACPVTFVLPTSICKPSEKVRILEFAKPAPIRFRLDHCMHCQILEHNLLFAHGLVHYLHGTINPRVFLVPGPYVI